MEQFYLVHVSRFEPSQERTEPDELAAFLGFGWWSAEEIAASDEWFVPRHLAAHLAGLVREGPPSMVVDVGD